MENQFIKNIEAEYSNFENLHPELFQNKKDTDFEFFKLICVLMILKRRPELKRFFESSYYDAVISFAIESFIVQLNGQVNGSHIILRASLENFLKFQLEYNKINIDSRSFGKNIGTISNQFNKQIEVYERKIEHNDFQLQFTKLEIEIEKLKNNETKYIRLIEKEVGLTSDKNSLMKNINISKIQLIGFNLMSQQYGMHSSMSHDATTKIDSHNMNHYFSKALEHNDCNSKTITNNIKTLKIITIQAILIAENSFKNWEYDELYSLFNIFMSNAKSRTLAEFMIDNRATSDLEKIFN
ncbi:hypothetical protein JZO72_08315 [Vagococcus fluvialis]|uniref:hypothetical protein n=1 Tax=Vagococcus fluvialis TaxID=2738 RepID=UPI001A8FBB1A|nr:hypothetical protein [Vagococcus fluvialis]MBO0479633.1 hypothetical protein [Vagococcus fluvialis]MBO0485387.1 hypothetical protein [Vagococcus fluvialis]